MVESFAGFRREEVAATPVLWSRDERFQTLRCVLVVRRPFATTATAAARALVPALLLQGTEHDPDRVALARRMEELYGAVVAPGQQKLGEAHQLRATLDAVAGERLPGRPDQLASGLEMLADLLVRPRLVDGAFPAHVFERERSQLENAVRGLVDDKAGFAFERAIALACAGEPFASPEHGGLDAVLALRSRACEEARVDFLTRGERLVIAYGRLAENGLAERVAGFLARLPKAQPERVPAAVVIGPREPRSATEHTRLQQARLVLVFRWKDPHVLAAWPARRLLVGAFGGGPHSLLFQELREKRSLCYDVSAMPDRHKGLVFVQTGLQESAFAQSESGVVELLERVRRGELADDVLQAARAGVIAALQALDDSVAQRLAFAAEQHFLGVDETPRTLAVKYERVTRDQVIAAASDLWLDFAYRLAPALAEAAPGTQERPA